MDVRRLIQDLLEHGGAADTDTATMHAYADARDRARAFLDGSAPSAGEAEPDFLQDMKASEGDFFAPVAKQVFATPAAPQVEGAGTLPVILMEPGRYARPDGSTGTAPLPSGPCFKCGWLKSDHEHGAYGPCPTGATPAAPQVSPKPAAPPAVQTPQTPAADEALCEDHDHYEAQQPAVRQGGEKK